MKNSHMQFLPHRHRKGNTSMFDFQKLQYRKILLNDQYLVQRQTSIVLDSASLMRLLFASVKVLIFEQDRPKPHEYQQIFCFIPFRTSFRYRMPLRLLKFGCASGFAGQPGMELSSQLIKIFGSHDTLRRCRNIAGSLFR